MTRPDVPVDEMKFEAAFAELEEMVRKLESNELTLEEAIKTFERGQLLSRRCAALLEQADLKIRELTGQELDQQAG